MSFMILLKQLGVKTIREISRCENYEEYLDMAEANFNLVLDAEAAFCGGRYAEAFRNSVY